MSSQQFGNFSSDNKEYVINTPYTPRPWVNYLYNERYCLVLSNTAGGYSFDRDCKARRITRWQGQNLTTGRPGHYLYIRDDETEDFWSATVEPVKAKFENYECRHGLGYTRIKTTCHDITSEIVYFVSLEDDVECWNIKLKNNSNIKRKLALFPYVEWLLGNRDDDLILPAIVCLYKKATWHPDKNLIFATSFGAKKEENAFNAFLGTNMKVSGYECRKEMFLGTCGDYSAPRAVREGKCTSTFGFGEDLVGALKIEMELLPGEEKSGIVCMGIARNLSQGGALVKKYSEFSKVENELNNIKYFWEKVINKNVVSTPDENFNRFVNIWMKYQLYTCNSWSRSSSFYHEGEGGRGYRDSSQDSESMVSLDSESSKKKILKLAHYQYTNGQPAAGWSEVRGVYSEKPFKDHGIWLTFTLNSYVKETGDLKFLKTKVGFHDGGKEITLYEHAKRAIDFILKDTGPRGLPHFGMYNHADWNDAFDALMGQAESLWLAMGLSRALIQFIEMAGWLKDKKTEQRYIKELKKMNEKINKYGWDGKWFLRGFDNEGKKLGSKECKEGKIFANTQSWAVLGNVSDKTRLVACLDSVEKILECEFGTALFSPAYTKHNPGLGRITLFVSGTKENAAVFCHAAAFKIVADCMLKRNTEAFKTFSKILPNNHPQEIYKSEPYVFAEYITGPLHPYKAREGAFTWLTGTTGWMYQIAVKWMIGIHPDINGMWIDPCLPPAWKSIKIDRCFRNSIYKFDIKNISGKGYGIKSVRVDKKKIKGNFIKDFKDGKEHIIEVELY